MGKFVTRNNHAQRIDKVMLSRKAKQKLRNERKVPDAKPKPGQAPPTP